MTASHQTVRLSRGKHSSPHEGVCVMELASMLAGEPFSDRPRAVCPVIGAFMRIYNDRLDDDRRQDLYAYASAVVGTSDAGAEAVIDRARACEEFAERMAQRRPRLIRLLSGRRRRQSPTPSAAGVAAARSLPKVDDEVHSLALAHIDLLVSLGRDRSVVVPEYELVLTAGGPVGAQGAALLGSRLAGTEPSGGG